MTMLQVSDPSCFIHAWAVKRVAWPWCQWADWISRWVAMVAYSEKSTCRTTLLLPSHSFTKDLNDADCLHVATAGSEQLMSYCQEQAYQLHLCTRSISTHALLWGWLTSDLIDEPWKIGTQGSFIFQSHKQKRHIHVIATYTHLMWDLIEKLLSFTDICALALISAEPFLFWSFSR